MSIATPSAFSAASMNVQTITDLSLLNPLTSTYNGFIDKYPALSKKSYILQTEADGKIKFTENRTFYWNEKRGKFLPAFSASGNVAAPGTITDPITVTLGSGSYFDDGTKSPVAEGQIYQNQRNGNQYRVTTVNKATPNAHTATMRPLATYGTGNVVAGDPFTYMANLAGEASTTKDGLYIDRQQLNNELVTIRTFQKYTDWSKQNVTEIKDMNGAFMGIEKLNDPSEIERFLEQQEMYLMEGAPITNVTELNNTNKGLLQSIDELYSTATAIDDAFFAELRRRSDANGYTNNYDMLTDTEFMIKFTNYIKSNFNNGAIVYAIDSADNGKDPSIAANFHSFRIYDMQFNTQTYAYFNAAQVYGTDPAYGLRKNFSLNIPQGLGTDVKTNEKIPHFGIRWTSVDGRPDGDMIKVIRTGGLAPIATDQTLDVTISHTTNKAVQVFANNGYLKIDLNV